MKNFDETDWVKTKSLLREHLTAPRLEHPDFVNSRILAEIARQGKTSQPAMLPLPWLAWTSVLALLMAGMLIVVVLPQQEGRRSDAEFISQVVTARAEMPHLSVSEFRAPDNRGVVIWIEGAEYIPAEDSVR